MIKTIRVKYTDQKGNPGVSDIYDCHVSLVPARSPIARPGEMTVTPIGLFLVADIKGRFSWVPIETCTLEGGPDDR